MKKLIYIFCILLFNNIVFAQYGRIPKPQKPDKVFRQMEKQRMKEMKKKNKNKDRLTGIISDLEDYTQDKIIPMMKEWKLKIDTSLSPNDKIFLDSLRLLTDRIKEDNRELKKNKTKAAKTGNEDIKAEDAQRMKENKKQSKEISNELKSLFGDYKTLFDPIKSECKQKTDIWEKEASDMVIKWTDAKGLNLTDKEKKRLEECWKYSGKINLNVIALWNGKSGI
jgi:hypothetical protein